MKKLFLLPAIVLAVTACNFADDEDYKNLAKDTCDCVNKTREGISDRALQIIIDSGGDEDKMMEGLEAYAEEDPMAAMSDGVAMQKFGTEFPACIEGLEAKYDHLYSSDSEEVIQERLIKALRELDGCEMAADLMQVGMAFQ